MMQSISQKPVLSPLNGKPILLNFDGAEMRSDAGLTLLREVERRGDLAGLVAKGLPDPRAPGKVRHSLQDIIRFRIMMIAAGYEDGNDADDLRHDPACKLALERGPETGAALCAQPTISRMENLGNTRALIRMGRAMVRFYCASFARAQGRIVLDIDDTFDTVHGHQQLRLFTASGQSRRPAWEIVTPNDLRNSDVVSMEKLAFCHPTGHQSQKPKVRNR